MNNDAGAQGPRPVLRWPGLVHPAAPTYLGFPVPLPPTQSRISGAEAEKTAQPNSVAAVISALQGVDVGYL